jgi:hypothetical protein
MMDDGVKAAGVDDDQVKVADIAIHVLDAIENGERATTSFEPPPAYAAPPNVATPDVPLPTSGD